MGDVGAWRRVCMVGKSHLPKSRVFKTHYRAKMQARIIIQGLYGFLPSFWGEVYDLIKQLLLLAILFLGERGKSYNFCRIPSKISGKMQNFHNSLLPHGNIIEFFYDDITDKSKTVMFENSMKNITALKGLTIIVNRYHLILRVTYYYKSQ